MHKWKGKIGDSVIRTEGLPYMFSKLTRGTDMSRRFITSEIKSSQDLRQSMMPWMAEASMPKIDGCSRSSEGKWLRQAQRIELTGALRAKHHRDRSQILNRETTRVKFNRYIIVSS
jgi:hypothetical protein